MHQNHIPEEIFQCFHFPGGSKHSFECLAMPITPPNINQTPHIAHLGHKYIKYTNYLSGLHQEHPVLNFLQASRNWFKTRWMKKQAKGSSK